MTAELPRTRLPVLALVLVAACNGSGDDPSSRQPTARDAPPAGERGVDPQPTDGDTPVCRRGGPFVAHGPMAVSAPAAGDAREIADLRWERHEGCERLVIDLTGDDGQPAASAGEVHGEVIRDLGLVRVSLRNVESVDTDATDTRFDGPLARAAYAVRSAAGPWTYVDIHLADAAEAHLLLLDRPARVVVDLRPGGRGLPAPPTRSRRVVVLEPRPGPASYPITVTGYARTFEANVQARLEQSGEVVRDTFTTATAWVEAWGEYTITFRDGPTGPVRLHVGEHSARDGTWEGVAVELDAR